MLCQFDSCVACILHMSCWWIIKSIDEPGQCVHATGVTGNFFHALSFGDNATILCPKIQPTQLPQPTESHLVADSNPTSHWLIIIIFLFGCIFSCFFGGCFFFAFCRALVRRAWNRPPAYYNVGGGGGIGGNRRASVADLLPANNQQQQQQQDEPRVEYRVNERVLPDSDDDDDVMILVDRSPNWHRSSTGLRRSRRERNSPDRYY